MSEMALSTRLTVGSDVRLTCPAWGYETPNVTWYRGGKPVHSTQRRRRQHSGSTGSDDDAASLELSDVQEDDRAEYKCTAVNRHGRASRTTLLRVTGTYMHTH